MKIETIINGIDINFEGELSEFEKIVTILQNSSKPNDGNYAMLQEKWNNNEITDIYFKNGHSINKMSNNDKIIIADGNRIFLPIHDDIIDFDKTFNGGKVKVSEIE